MQTTGPRHKLQKSPKIPNISAATNNNNHVPFTNLAPQTSTEHYWASRALKAEALLAARERHHEEVGRVRKEEELKRINEVQNLENKYKEKHDRFERLIFVLVVALVLLIALTLYLMVASTRHGLSPTSIVGAPIGSLFPSIFPLNVFGLSNHKDTGRNSASWFNLHLHLPSHFTIPILSPWTSVVENQASTITNVSTSKFSKYVIIISLVVCAVISALVFLNNPSNHDKSSHQHVGRINRIWWPFTHPNFFSAWRLAWSLGSTMLSLIGFAPR